MERLIKNGRLITFEGSPKADLAINNGLISAIGTDLKAEAGCEVIDADGLYVLPGAIDAHTHLEMEMGRTFSADSYESGTIAAACGGTTTLIDYTLQEKGGSILDMIRSREALCAPSASIDYSFHGGISDVNDTSLAEMETVVKYGIPSFKVYMTYDFSLNDRELYLVLERSRQIGAFITVHAENKGIIEARVAKYKHAGTMDAWHHYLSRPEFVEEEADFRAMTIAKNVGAPLYLVHLASEGGVRLLREAKADGYPIYGETCPQYLEFTSDVYRSPDGVRFLCSPPIKGPKSKEALWNAIKNGDISTIATDHCPSQAFEKEWGRDDFTKAPNGCMGIENMYPYLLSEANKGRISFQKAAALCAFNPAKLFGLAPRKGVIQPGADADLVLYDPAKEFIITKEKMHSAIDYTIWEGVKLNGYPVMTMLRGKTVYKDGVFMGSPGSGRFIKRKPFSCGTLS